MESGYPASHRDITAQQPPEQFKHAELLAELQALVHASRWDKSTTVHVELLCVFVTTVSAFCADILMLSRGRTRAVEEVRVAHAENAALKGAPGDAGRADI